MTGTSTPQIKGGHAQGFSLVEMLVAITVTMIIMGSVYGLMAQGQSAFGREPLLADRQQQVRIAMDRIQRDVVLAGMSLGNNFQAFATGLNNVGPVGVRAAADTALGGGNSDYIEIRTVSGDCPPIRTEPGNELDGANLNTVESFPDCYPEPGFVFLLFPDGNAKFGWLHNQHSKGDDKANFPGGQQPPGSQIDTNAPAHINCSLWFGTMFGLTSPNGNTCPPEPVPPDPYGCPDCAPHAILMAHMIRYQIGTDTNNTATTTDDVPSLYRHTNGGIDANDAVTNPPGTGWQLIARGIEDLQVEYRTANDGWINSPELLAQGSWGDVVQEVRITLWARTVGNGSQAAGNVGDGLTGETRAAGNQVMAVRSALVTTVAPRAAQMALNAEGQWK